MRDLSIQFRFSGVWTDVVQGLSLEVPTGGTVGLVGESGSGKSVTSLAIAGLLRLRGGRVSTGSIAYKGRELTTMLEADMRDLRGSSIGMIFQQPTRCLNPAYTVGDQIAEVMRIHVGIGREAARSKAISLLERVGIARASVRVDDYPHQFSGGMCQRVMIAMALAGEPDLLIADEPTTALDVTIQAKILQLLGELQAERKMAMMLITHDLGVVAEHCKSVVVMHAGQVLECGPTARLLESPLHPYTSGLLAAVQMRRVNGELITIPGTAPRPGQSVPGCRFHTRCEFKSAGLCDTTVPQLLAEPGGHAVRCLRTREWQSSRIPSVS